MTRDEELDIEVEYATHGTYGYLCIYDKDLKMVKWSRRCDLEPNERFLSVNAYKQYVERLSRMRGAS